MTNKLDKESERIKQLQEASLHVREESMNVNAEFEKIENDPDGDK